MDFTREYSGIKDDYSDFLEESKRYVEKRLNKEGVELAFPITSRVKTINSIKEKHESGRFNLKKSVTELEDLVGIRIVVLFADDKEKIVNLLKGEFDLFNERKFDSGIDKFGYSSFHLIIKPKPEWKGPPWDAHRHKLLEVQVRTLSEHIWAETSHNLFYKVEENIPKEIRRELSQLAALLEVADEKLQNVKNSVNTYISTIAEMPYDEILKLDLNPFTLKRVYSKYYPKSEKEDLLIFKKINKEIEKDYNINLVKRLDKVLSESEFKAKSFDEFNTIVKAILKKNLDEEIKYQINT